MLGDIFSYDWADADFIFCNSTCFTNEMMERIYEQSLKAKKGTWFATMSKKLPHVEFYGIAPNNQKKGQAVHWEFILAVKLNMSWGPATVNL